MAMSAARGKLCVLFADVSGSARLRERLGDREAMRAVERCLKRMERATAAYKGQVVKIIGDQIMASFDDADGALQAASEMQHRVADLPPLSGVKLAIRAGFHYGSASEATGAASGDTVNTAARVVGLAKPGQILTTQATVDALAAHLRQSARTVEVPAGNRDVQDIRIFEVAWQNAAELTLKAAAAKPAKPLRTWLRLRHGSREIVVDQDLPAASLGRDTGNDIVIKDPRASRLHARIEWRHGKYVVVDLSTNGTYVVIDGEAEFVLKHEEALLRGRGRLAFGHSGGDGSDEVIEFELIG